MRHPMNLIFSNPLELIAPVGAVFSVRSIAADGETNWSEGVLIGVNALFGIAVFFSGRAA
jgi:Ca2+:H+ antiporter